MASESSPAEAVWLPDGVGLPPIARQIIGQEGGIVHLRLIDGRGTYPRGGCDRGLGQWWSGRPAEVTCSACLELVHA